MPPRRALRIFALVYALILGTVTACQPPVGSSAGSGASQANQSPKRVTAVVMGELNALNAKVNTSMATIGQRGQDEAERLVNSGLTVLDAQGARHPQLADQFPTSENGLWQIFPDGHMVTTWKLHPGAHWHDGVPFTTDDIVFTYQLVKDRDLATFHIATSDYVQSLDAPDPLTLTVTWTAPTILADDLFSNSGSGGNPAASSLLPRHLLERPYLDNRDSFFELPYWNLEFVGTGPFKLREFARSSYVRLTANDDFVL
ncbi:MAG TPA: ABC transporter substrate-binding protein, partial [Chloroflexota bacterium]